MLVLQAAALFACSGTSATDGPAIAGKPDIECGEEHTLVATPSAKGLEQWCDQGGLMDGPYLLKFPNGKRAVKGSYAQNLEDGDWWAWYDNGQERYQGKYNKAKKTGPWTSWHSNGNRAEEGDYLQNRKIGQWTTWYESGHKREEGLYQNDSKNGTWLYYNDDEANAVAKTEKWENGQVTETKGTDPVVSPPAP
ncbi:MAG: hypothetical protein ABMA64_19175 [Myxococcota bacterium]